MEKLKGKYYPIFRLWEIVFVVVADYWYVTYKFNQVVAVYSTSTLDMF